MIIEDMDFFLLARKNQKWKVLETVSLMSSFNIRASEANYTEGTDTANYANNHLDILQSSLRASNCW